MFSKSIVDTDAFLEMPQTSQLLYFHLNLQADDDGFVGSPKKIMRGGGFKEDDLKVLLAKRFLLSFESGVVVIKHWKIHNTLRLDRHTETNYKKEKLTLKTGLNKAYTENGNQVATIGEHSIEEISIDKNSKEENSKEKKLESSSEYLRKVPEEDIKEFVLKFNCYVSDVVSKAEDLNEWCLTNGKRKSNYKSFLRFALKRDFGLRPVGNEAERKNIEATQKRYKGSSPFAKDLTKKFNV